MSGLLEKANGGDADAMVDLGAQYYTGSGGVKKDYSEALAWFNRAAAKENGTALYYLGLMHEHGHGTRVDLNSALNYYRQGQQRSSRIDCNQAARRLAADPALRTATATAAAQPQPAATTAAGAAAEAARLEQEKARAQKQVAANKQKEADLQQLQQTLEAQRTRQQQKDREQQQKDREQQQKDAAQQQKDEAQQQKDAGQKQKEAELKQQQQTLEDERVRQHNNNAELQQRETKVRELEQAVKQERDALDAVKREQDDLQRAKEVAAANLIKAKKNAAAAKQAEILQERQAEGSDFVSTRNAVVAAWEPTKVKLSDCPVHVRPMTPGQSVLLEKCLHAICRDCAPQMIQPDNSVRCPICQADSSLQLDALPPHPFIEAELAAGEAHDCAVCQTVPDDDRMPATVKCTSCISEKLLCEGHAVNHRMNPKTATHTLTPLPHGGAALRCPTHSEPIAAYCTKCRQLICPKCTLKTHRGDAHHVLLLTESEPVDGVRARLVAGVALARTVAGALIDHGANATVAVNEVNRQDAAISTEIDRTINVMVGILERRREAAHTQRLALARDQRAALQTTRLESEFHWRIVTSAADLAEQLATGTHLGVNVAAVMVQLEEAAMARLHAVLELAPERDIPPPAILRFNYDESVGKQLETLGEIVRDA